MFWDALPSFLSAYINISKYEMPPPPSDQVDNVGSGTQSQQGVDLKFGLDGSITEVVHDRGEKEHRNDFPPGDDIPTDPPATLTLKELARALNRAKVASFHEEFAYIPRSVLEKIMNYPQVLAIMTNLETPRTGEEGTESFARRICYGESSKPPCRKLLAALVAAQLEDLFQVALDDKMDDDCFPLKYTPRTQSMSLSCRIQSHRHSEFESQLHPGDLDTLIRWTRALTAPYIKQLPNKHFHYVLEHGDHLPFQIAGQVMQNLETNEVTVVPSGTDVDPDRYMAHGGFGKVFKIQIHPSHWSFCGNDPRDPNTPKWFALKQLNDNDAGKFEMELKSLLYCLHHRFVDEALLREGQKHMAHVRSSIEVRNPTNNKTDYYFLFDWQSGNLSQFWQNEEKLRDNPHHLRWMSQQIFGLAAALQCVHNDRSAHQTPGRQLNNVTVYGRHGDLGPSNILYSRTENGNLELKLTDFGLAQLHSRVSRTFGNSTYTPRTETYGGPDFDIQDGSISRATDIFSFGCVVLEFITWYLLGYEGVEAFSDARLVAEPHRAGFQTDKYYNIIPVPPNGQKAVLKDQVKTHIINLENHERCSWYLRDMLHLVRDKMLDPEPKNRMQSHQLTKRLDAIRKTCEADPSYYSAPWKSVLPKEAWQTTS